MGFRVAAVSNSDFEVSNKTLKLANFGAQIIYIINI